MHFGNTKILTLTLDPNSLKKYDIKKTDNKISQRNIMNESIYEKFLFTGKPEEKKINVIFQNSLYFNETEYKKDRNAKITG